MKTAEDCRTEGRPAYELWIIVSVALRRTVGDGTEEEEEEDVYAFPLFP